MLLRNVTVYETTSRFYIIGSDVSDQQYSVLKIDRTEPKSLIIGDSGHVYSRQELYELLATINDGNAVIARLSDRWSRRPANPGLTEKFSRAYGLLGAVRFLEGYYLIMVTKATIVASFGYHYVYKIAEVTMIYVGCDAPISNADEQRYVKMFQSVDLTTDFYFSYTYDLSQTLQDNVIESTCCVANNIDIQQQLTTKISDKYIWNNYLLQSLRDKCVPDHWLLPIVHGFVGQTILELPAAKLSLTLIGRRSSNFAGTRFLKRGANFRGDVANDVETEQIVWEISSSPSFHTGKFTSFVQCRGSVPLIWSQDPAKRPPVVTGKPPPIIIDINEPFAQAAGAHFRELRRKYGCPIIVMNLVKRREKRPHESVLHDQFVRAISYLNQFVPPADAILYLSFDVARCNKIGSVLPKLEEIGYNAVMKQGWFQTFPPLYSHTVRPDPLLVDYHPQSRDRLQLQTGISRTNCVDCLDRTNVAQFAISKVALACQLYSLGLIDKPVISVHSEICRVLEELYDQHGDTLALQYAGSQLVHSIKTYKKTAAFQERSRDVLQTLSRYYSNTFGDYDKQNAINLFLGLYRPQSQQQGTRHVPPLWELQSDTYLHSAVGRSRRGSNYCAWMLDSSDSDDEEDEEDIENGMRTKSKIIGLVDVKKKSSVSAPKSYLRPISDYDTYYRTFELSNFELLLKEQKDQKCVAIDSLSRETMLTSTRVGAPFIGKFWPKSSPMNISSVLADPIAPIKEPQQQSIDTITNDSVEKRRIKPKSVGGGLFSLSSTTAVSTGSTSSSEDEDDTSIRSDTEIVYSEEFQNKYTNNGHHNYCGAIQQPTITGKGLSLGLKSMKEAYGCELREPSKVDMDKYIAYAQLGGLKLNSDDWNRYKPKRLSKLTIASVDYNQLKPLSMFTNDSVFSVDPPTIADASRRIYEDTVACATRGPKSPSKRDQKMYERHAIYVQS